MAVIGVEQLYKSFRVSANEPGFVNALRHFFRRKYRLVEAVKPLSFQIEAGEIVGFLGPNGAGKDHDAQNALRAAASLRREGDRRWACAVPPTEGISKDDHTGDGEQAATHMGFTGGWSPFEINGAIYDVPDGELAARIEELSGMLALEKRHLTQPVRKLSLGERMKCELLASLLHRPSVLFLDEPTLGLDVNAQTAVRTFLKQYNAKYGATILLTSHYMADITALCKRVLLIHQGTLFYDGALSGIIDRFAPYREVKLDFAQDVERSALEPLGEIVSAEGRRRQRFLVRREAAHADGGEDHGEPADRGSYDQRSAGGEHYCGAFHPGKNGGQAVAITTRPWRRPEERSQRSRQICRSQGPGIAW